jgi:hypothetical protein
MAPRGRSGRAEPAAVTARAAAVVLGVVADALAVVTGVESAPST